MDSPMRVSTWSSSSSMRDRMPVTRSASRFCPTTSSSSAGRSTCAARTRALGGRAPCCKTRQLRCGAREAAHQDGALLEDHGHGAALAQLPVQAVDLLAHQLHERRALAAHAAAAGQHRQRTARRTRTRQLGQRIQSEQQSGPAFAHTPGGVAAGPGQMCKNLFAEQSGSNAAMPGSQRGDKIEWSET